MTRLFFVCTGNICRSPMAEYLFRDMLHESGVDEVEIGSAGVAASRGREASPPAVRVLEEEGVEGIKMHQSRPLNDVDPSDVDLVLTMTRSHLAQLPPGYDESGPEVDLLKRYVGVGGGFPDPYGGTVARYRELKEEMIPVLRKLESKITGSSPNNGTD